LSRLTHGLTWAAATAVLVVPFVSPGSPVSLVNVALEQSSPLTITGRIDGLLPHVPAGLVLDLHNASDLDVSVRSVQAHVTGAPDGCSADALSLGRWSGTLQVPAHGKASATIPVQLSATGSGCLGATWQLAYAST
jgi:hypothetical protein